MSLFHDTLFSNTSLEDVFGNCFLSRFRISIVITGIATIAMLDGMDSPESFNNNPKIATMTPGKTIYLMLINELYVSLKYLLLENTIYKKNKTAIMVEIESAGLVKLFKLAIIFLSKVTVASPCKRLSANLPKCVR